MKNYVLCLSLQKVALPTVLLACTIFRPCLISGLYLLLALLLPFFNVADKKSYQGSTGCFLRVIVVISFFTVLAQIGFQVVLFSLPPYAHFLPNCSLLESILRYVGLVNLKEIDILSAVIWLGPELVMLCFSVFTYVIVGKLAFGDTTEFVEETELGVEGVRKRKGLSVQKGKFAVAMGCLLATLSLCVASSIKPTVIGGFYFIVFIGAGCWWASGRDLRRGYAYILRFVQLVAAGQLIANFTYQIQFFQPMLSPDSLIARLVGLEKFVVTSCDDPRKLLYRAKENINFLDVIFVYIMYFITIQVASILMEPQLLRGISSTNATSRRSTHSKRSGEGDGSEVGGDNIPMQDIDKDGDRYEEASTTIETIFYAVCSLMFVIIRSSYLATNIIMMTWSITYHSWLTLVLLMWANVIWLFPNQRKSMLYSSPFLLLYAIFLIISQYVYALDLLDSELPVKITNFNLEQIGFYRPLSYKFAPILIKSLFTAMFAVTTRQYMQERKEAKKRSTLADIVSPLQVTMGAAVSQQQEEMTQNAFVKKFGASVRLFLVKYWIWVVAFTLFLSGITGQNMTAFRIIYMALFLTFLFLFQVSWRLWRSLMYLFWVIVIVYSMTLLVILYTYQFDNFPDYWEKYLFIDKDLQNDIGLVKYSTSDLFARLLTATFFVIISVIQVHYFHKEFLNMTRLQINERTVYDSESGTDKRSQSTTATQAHRRTLSDDSEFPPTTPTQKRDNVYYSTIEADASRIFGTWESWKSHAEYIVNLIWLFLELHMLKIVLFAIMLMSANDISAIHFVLITMTVISLPFGRKFIFTVRVIVSGVICVVFLLRMIYQIDYITHDYWQIDCSESISNTTDTSSYNMAAWLGFQKLQNDQSLFNLLRWYIIYIAIATFQSVVDFRQIHQRQKIGASLKVPSVMFPEIAREDADKDSWHCLKYLLNYGFYKFGVECSLVCTVMIVCYRTDVYAVFYGIWLAVMCTAPRERIEKLWNYFMLFTVVIVPFQYFCVVGLPPFLCLEYPWNDNATLRALQAWFYAMNNVSPPPATKIILDFVLLICQTRQRIVFYIERRYDKKDRYYPGGSNKDITKDADVIDFVNPVPDFVMVIRTWLDIWKRGIFIVFLWFTLATIFLTGTSRVNVFSIGYLVGAFLFLWQGSDLFLRPITNITNIWDYLIMYNVFVTLTKSILSLFGCVFIAFIQQYACWAIEVFNIGCIQYFYQGKPDRIASPSINFDDTNANCDASTQFDEMSLHWDLFCFACLIFQRRIFKSYYFFHIIDETKAMTILASRGAELIEELRRKHVKEQEEKEKQILENIKTKMDRIKENQKKIQGPNYADPDNHFVDKIYPGCRPLYRKRIPVTNREAVRSGDYYMFDNIDDGEDYSFSNLQEEPTESEVRLKGQDLTFGEERVPLVPASTSRDDPDTPRKPKEKYDQESVSSRATESDKPERSGFEEIEPKTIKEYIIVGVMVVWIFVKSVLLTMTIFFNKFSKNYRFVRKVLIKEKKLLKEKNTFRVGIRRGSAQIWQPLPSTLNILQRAREQPDSDEIIVEQPIVQPSTSAFQPSYEVPKLEEVEEMSSADQPVPIRLALSLWFFVLANSEICCYFMVFLNQIKSASIVSLPLPLMVFLWGTLTIPRPTKTFWVTMIAYVEVLVIVKCMFQFRFLPWNELDASTSPFFPPRILGIERKADYATYDLWLLLIIFFHRSMLKSLGLWKSSYAPIPHFSGPLFYPEDDTPLVLPGTQENLIEKSIDEGNDGKSQALVTQGGGLVMFRPKSNPTVEEVPQEDEDNPVEKVISNVVIPEPTSSELEAMGSKFDLVVVSTNDHEPYDYFPNVIGLSVKRHFSPAIKFWQKLKDPSLRVATDVYAYMFLCDFFNFLVIIFGFTAFGTQQGDGGVQAYLKENKVPIPFLVMLILQFILILIDRALFLRKYILGKIIFQFALIALVHIYMFFVLPAITERGFNSRLAPQMWYMVKCFYLLLSAYQIRSGYPTRILGNFLCKGYNYINFGLFKCFMLIPFLFELRTIMDWIWTDTSMTLFDWLKMEDIFANIFQLKCQRYNEKEFPQVRGEKKPDMSKFLMGGAALFIIIGIIWFPLVLFALGKTVGVPNIPIDVTMKLHVGSYLSIYSMSAQTNQIIPFGPQKWDTVNSFYLQSKDRVATTFLTGYDADDVCEVALSTSSTTIWNISPPDEERLYNELNSSNIIQIRAQYIAKRDATNLNGPAELSFEAKFDLPANEPDGSRTPQRIALMNMLRKSQDPNATVDSVLIPYMLPKFLRLSSSLGTMSTVDTLMKQTPHAFDQVLRNITISLSRQEGSSAKWWVVKENCSGYNYENVLKEIPGSNCGQLQLYLFNEKKFPPTLSFISGGGIISLYTTLVFFASRFVRGFFSDIYSKIMFEDLPNVDRIMQLCLDIYLVRESRELALEEDLFAKLVFLYRSPETLIKWTRPKYELVGDESELGQPSITNQPAN